MTAQNPHRVAVLVALLCLSNAAARAADLDPIELLKQSAATVAASPSVSVDFLAETTLVRDDETSVMADRFSFRTAPGQRFELVSTAPEGGVDRKGLRVLGNGKVTVTQLTRRKRHTLEGGDEGLAAFVRSPSAAGIGSGLGGLALALLNPSAAAELSESVTASEYLGVADVDGETLHHARYTVQGGVTWDAWFTTTEGAPLVRRIVHDLLDTPAVQSMAQRHETFDYQLRFEFREWNTQAGLEADAIRVVEPQGSMLMGSFYERPPRPPYALLGKEAPGFELPTPTGELKGLAEHAGEDVVLLEFWATTCPICLQAMPALETLSTEYQDRGLDYYAVNIGENPSDVGEFLEARGLDPAVLVDQEGEVSDAYRVGPIPLILLVGRDGVVQAAHEGFGPPTVGALTTEIEAALRDEDLAAAELERRKAEQAARLAERQRLRSLLDS